MRADRTARPAGTSTAVTIVLVVVTALIGILILGKINDESNSNGASLKRGGDNCVPATAPITSRQPVRMRGSYTAMPE